MKVTLEITHSPICVIFDVTQNVILNVIQNVIFSVIFNGLKLFLLWDVTCSNIPFFLWLQMKQEIKDALNKIKDKLLSMTDEEFNRVLDKYSTLNETLCGDIDETNNNTKE